MLSVLYQNPVTFVFVATALIISISIHEFAHAFVADRLGDPTARFFKRVTLNPLAHLDPLGTLMLLFAGFGWGKPVPFNPANLRNPKRDSSLIALAGPVSNFLLAILLAALVRFFYFAPFLGSFFYLAIFYNLILGFFNLIPVYPLDGFKVVYGFLPVDWAWKWENLKPYGVYILLILILTKSTGVLISPLVGISTKLLGL